MFCFCLFDLDSEVMYDIELESLSFSTYYSWYLNVFFCFVSHFSNRIKFKNQQPWTQQPLQSSNVNTSCSWFPFSFRRCGTFQATTNLQIWILMIQILLVGIRRGCWHGFLSILGFFDAKVFFFKHSTKHIFSQAWDVKITKGPIGKVAKVTANDWKHRECFWFARLNSQNHVCHPCIFLRMYLIFEFVDEFVVIFSSAKNKAKLFIDGWWFRPSTKEPESCKFAFSPQDRNIWQKFETAIVSLFFFRETRYVYWYLKHIWRICFFGYAIHKHI